MKTKWLIGSGILLLAVVVSGPALAENGEEEGEKVLETVIVTAQKKQEDLQKVPSSVATLSDERLNAITSGGPDIRALSSRVPSLHIESSYGRTLPRFYIRGLGNTDFDLNASQPVSLVYDGVVLENPILKGFPMFDLDRVEVLRGPQGTLFGRNTPAGIVKFESRKPSHDPDGYARMSYGLYDTAQLEAAQGGSVVDDILAARFSILYQSRDDWVDNISAATGPTNQLGGYKDVAGRAQLLYTPTPEFSALLNGHLRDLNGTARLFRANLVESGSSDIVSDFERDEITVDGGNQQELRAIGGSAKLEYDAGSVTITSITGFEKAELYSRGDVDGGFGADFLSNSDPPGIPFPAETADGIPFLEQITEEVRLASNGWDQVNFQTGFFYFREDLDVDTYSYDTFGGGVEDGFSTQRQEARAYGVFGAVEVDATDRLKLAGGVRFSNDEKDFSAVRTLSPFGAPTLTASVKPDDSVVGWDGSALFAVNPDVNVFGRVARGFRTPSIQGRILFGDVVSVADTETILSYEAGVKTRLAGGRARANLTGFFYQMDDQQLTAVGGAGNFNTLLNADKSKGMGFEAELDFLVTDRLLATAGVSFNNTEIDDPDLTTQVGGAAGITVLDPIATAPDIVSIDGNSLPNAPEWVANFTLRNGFPLGPKTEFFFFTDWAYRSEVSFFLYESVEFMESSLVEGGLRLGFAHIDGDYEIALFGRNILDDESRTGGIDFNNLLGFVNEPRTFGIEILRAL